MHRELRSVLQVLHAICKCAFHVAQHHQSVCACNQAPFTMCVEMGQGLYLWY